MRVPESVEMPVFASNSVASSGSGSKKLHAHMRMPQSFSALLNSSATDAPAGLRPPVLKAESPQRQAVLADALRYVQDAVKQFSEAPFFKMIEARLPFKAAEPAPSSRDLLADQYAESPFEKSLFLLEKTPGETIIADTWAAALLSHDEETREAAVKLLQDRQHSQNMETTTRLSPHTQLKLMHFSGHLDDGVAGMAKLYLAASRLPLAQAMPLLEPLPQAFAKFPVMSQLQLIQSLSAKLGHLSAAPESPEREALQQLLKAIVLKLYTTPDMANEVLVQQLLQRQEKIRLGFVRLQPIEEAHQAALAETDKRYRSRLRQLKRQRQLLMVQADEERDRRIGQVYDEISSPLLATLKEADLDDLLAQIAPEVISVSEETDVALASA